ncbi:MAG: AAA family ATPase [Syntrophorhabdaceae bacterium]|nr:AAA family ATPase [Syntrophorhabdaceae bacterium]MDD5245440.1 AAA family ATPase [Syntrophorhabdaceae bacterium]
MYTEYWGLKKPPFDNVPDPSMYVESHASVENTIAETLFAIEEGNECLTVIVGDVGLGKTLSLRMILDSLDHEKYKIAFVTNPDMSFVQLLKEIIGQLTGKQCERRGKVDLLETFNKLLFETIDEGKKVLIFIDEANAISPANLESLRLLTNMQDDTRNLFTIVLAGQMELASRLEHPKRANLFQRIGTYNRIDKIESEELVRNYVETRVKLAGGTRNIFTDDAIHWLWEYSDHGVPRLVNKIAKLCLKAGETNRFDTIIGDVVKQIGERFEKLTGPAIQKRKSRERPTPQAPREEIVTEKDRKKKILPKEAKAEHVAPPPPPPEEVVREVVVIPPEPQVTIPPAEEKIQEPLAEVPPPPAAEPPPPPAAEPPPPPAAEQPPTPPPPEAPPEPPDEPDVATIAGFKIKIDIPPHILEQTQSANTEHRRKIAGVLAAQTLEKNPQLTASPSVDPVSIWSEILNVIMKKLGS